MTFHFLSPAHDVGRDFWLDGTACDRVELEIGPGNCGFLVEAARRSPGTLFAGIEIQPSSLARPLARPLPPNVRLITGDGGWMVQNLLAPASLDALHVYFPDPWWKKRHHKRRLFQPAFCEAAGRVLVPGGAVHVVTDVAQLFAEIRQNLLGAGFAEEPWTRSAEDPACSAYERKYRIQGRRFEAARFIRPK